MSTFPDSCEDEQEYEDLNDSPLARSDATAHPAILVEKLKV